MERIPLVDLKAQYLNIKVDVDAIEAQLNVDPAQLLECVFNDTQVAPEEPVRNFVCEA